MKFPQLFRKVLLFILLLFSVSVFSQEAYVKFSETPPMLLDKKKTLFGNYKIEYKTKESSTIYLELRRKGKVIGNKVFRVQGRQKSSEVISIQLFSGIKLKTGSDYSYILVMFQAPESVWENRVGEQKEIINVSVVKRK